MKFEMERIALPWSLKDPTIKSSGRAPARSRNQAYGYRSDGSKIEYLLATYDGGMSDESGKMLYSAYVLVEITRDMIKKEDSFWFKWHSEPERKRLYIDSEGYAYRSWKGGSPVCNFFTGEVYKYKKGKKIA